jgi:hypothetical protein
MPILVILIVGLIYVLSEYSSVRVTDTVSESRASQTSNAEFPNALYTEQDALDIAIARLPPGAQVVNSQAKLLTYSQVAQWTNMEDPNSDTPAWLVGIEASGVTVNDSIGFIAGLIADDPLPNGSDPVPGIFTVWDANSGIFLGMGALEQTGNQSLTGIAGIVEPGLAVSEATIIPFPMETATTSGVR